MTTAAEWESAARAHGLEVVDEPTCPGCGNSGEVLETPERVRACECDGEYLPHCVATMEEFPRGTMGWLRVPPYRRPVSAVSQVGCECCGERPRLPGSDCCSECLEGAPTMRGSELGMGGAL